MNNQEIKFEREGKLCQLCDGDWISCSYGDEYRKTSKCNYFKRDESRKKMKVGDEVLLIIHGAGLVSEETGNIIESIDDKKLTLEDQDKIFYKNSKGIYVTEVGFMNFWYEVLENEKEN